VGGSSISPQVIDFFYKMGVPLYQAYGMTETSPLISISTPQSNKKGTVGKPLSCNEVFIIKDNKEVSTNTIGEICVRGSNVMKGYFNNNVANNNAFFYIDGKESLLHTGDKGVIDTDGYLSVIGRIKEEYKLSNGKYVNPTEVEDIITTNINSIQQIMIYGDGRDYNVAIVLSNDNEATLLQKIQQIKTLRKFEIPRRILLIKEPFTIENHLLTQKMSLRRENI
jgi:long-chain acyl-CoA synthetase